jgi:hypothetical protein
MSRTWRRAVATTLLKFRSSPSVAWMLAVALLMRVGLAAACHVEMNLWSEYERTLPPAALSTTCKPVVNCPLAPKCP